MNSPDLPELLRARMAELAAMPAFGDGSGLLLDLVAGYGGWSLDHDPTDSGVAAFLTGPVEMLREVIDEAEKQAPQR